MSAVVLVDMGKDKIQVIHIIDPKSSTPEKILTFFNR